MAVNPLFKAKIKSDWIVISLIKIKSIKEKRSSLILPAGIAKGAAPKNVLELAKEKEKANLTYADMPEQFKSEWDEHPMQGIIVGLGPKISPEEGHKIGDRVYFRGSTGEPIIIKKEFYLALKSHDIYCTIPKE